MNTTRIFNACCKSKILIAGLFFIAILSASSYANQLKLLVNSFMYSQTYCKHNAPKDSISFIKKHAKYAANLCLYSSNHMEENSILNKEFKVMLKEANTNPKTYGYYIGVAYYMGFGVPMDEQKAEYWLKKSSLLGSEQATLAYAQFLLTGMPLRCQEDFNSCVKQGLKNLAKLPNNPHAYDIKLGFATNSKKICQIAKIAVPKGNLNLYPAFIYCQTDGNKKQITSAMKVKLLEVINNKLTNIVAKTAAAQLLNDKKTYALLEPLNQ